MFSEYILVYFKGDSVIKFILPANFWLYIVIIIIYHTT